MTRNSSLLLEPLHSDIARYMQTEPITEIEVLWLVAALKAQSDLHQRQMREINCRLLDMERMVRELKCRL